MTGFKDNSGGVTGWVAWEGEPNDDAAHQTILGWLQSAVGTGFLEEEASLSNRVKGNLGEFIAYSIGKSYVFTNVANAYGANTWLPSRMSRGPTSTSYGCTSAVPKLTTGQRSKKSRRREGILWDSLIASSPIMKSSLEKNFS